MSDYGLPTPCNCCAPSCPALYKDIRARQYAGGWPCNFNEDGTEPDDPAPSEQCIINAFAAMREGDYILGAGLNSALDYIQTPGYNWRINVSELQYRYRMPEGPNTYFNIIVQEGFRAEGDSEFTPTAEKNLTWNGPGTAGDDDTWATTWSSQDAPLVEGTNNIISTRYRCYTGGPWIG